MRAIDCDGGSQIPRPDNDLLYVNLTHFVFDPCGECGDTLAKQCETKSRQPDGTRPVAQAVHDTIH